MTSQQILQTIYTDGFPNQIYGGPNNIIYKIINQNSTNFQFDYLSYDMFKSNVNKSNLHLTEKDRSTKKKIAALFWNYFNFYKQLTTNDNYLKFYYKKKHNYFNHLSKKMPAYDIIHAQDSISLGYHRNQSRSKKIMTVHSKGPLSDEIKNSIDDQKFSSELNNFLKKIEIQNVDDADAITFPSFAAQEYFTKSLEIVIPENKVKIIYNGIDLDKIKRIEPVKAIFEKYNVVPNGRKVIINVASHVPEKNINKLIEIVKQLKTKSSNDYILLNIGDQGVKNEYENLVNRLKLSKNIFFIGQIPNDDIIRFLKSSDIFLMTSEKVIFDLVVLEALACGIPVFVSNEGGNKEIIKNGENGYLIDINDIDNIVNQLTSFSYDKRVRNNAIKTANLFSVSKMANNYFDLYRNLMNEV